MNKSISLNKNLIIIGVPFSLMLILILLMKSPYVKINGHLDLAITIDLLLTVPLVYFVLIRKSQFPKTTVIPVMVLGLLIGSYFLPKESQTYLELFKTFALPVIELFIFTFIIIKIRKATKTYKELKGDIPDFYDALKNTCYEILPKKLVIPFATEIAVFYYGFFNWRKRSINENEFTYHQKSSTPTLLAGFIIVIGIETVALHFLLAMWSSTVAWVLTGLSLYTAIQILGFVKAIARRPLSIEENSVKLRYGIMNETEITYSEIVDVVLSKKGPEKDKLTQTLSPLGELDTPNVIIYLKSENTLVGLYGIKKKFKVLALYLDEPYDFTKKLKNVIQQNT